MRKTIISVVNPDVKEKDLKSCITFPKAETLLFLTFFARMCKKERAESSAITTSSQILKS